MTKLQEKKYFKMGYALLLNAVIMAFFLIVFPLHYEMPDDHSYSQFITDGNYIFYIVDLVLGYIIGMLQRIVYPINAYVIVSIVFSFVSFVSITRVFLDKFSLVIATAMSFVMLGFFGVNHYETVAFTRMPALMCLAGLLCVFHYTNKKEHWKLWTVIGVVLVLLGSLYRFLIFEVSVVVFVFYYIGKSITDYFGIDKSLRCLKDFLHIALKPKRIISLSVAVVLCFAVHYASYAIYDFDADYNYYRQYTSARSSVYDYDIPKYEDAKEEYNAINIDENDLELLKAGYFDQNGALSLKQLQSINEIGKKYRKTSNSYIGILKLMLISEIGNVRAVWKNGTIEIVNNGRVAGGKGVVYFLIGILLLLFIVLMKKRYLFIPILLGIISLALYYYLWIDNKVPFRAVYPILIGFTVLLMYSFSYDGLRQRFQKRNKCFKKKAVPICIILIFSMLFSGWGVYLSTIYNQYIDFHSDYYNQVNLYKYFEINKNSKYVIARNCPEHTLTDNIYFTEENPKYRNYEVFSGTYYNLPFIRERMERFGTENMYRYLLSEKTYFVVYAEDSHADMMKAYLQKYYSNGKTVDYKIVDTIDKYQICKYTLK